MDAKDKLIDELKAQNTALKAEISELKAKINALEKMLNTNSTNSGMPPSSDKFTQKFKQKNTSLREKSKNKSGGVVGHTGETLEMVSTPDEVVLNDITHCPVCNSIDLEDTQKDEVSQTLEIEPAKKRIIETRQRCKICKRCGHRICLAGSGTLRYGESAKAFAVYLGCYQFLSCKRTQEALNDICGTSPSEGSIVNWTNEYALKLQSKTEEIEHALLKSTIKHIDESGCGLKKKWLHVCSNVLFTSYDIAKRGSARWMPKLDKKHMLVVSDCFGAYLNKKFKNILCNQHIMRDCKKIDEEKWARWLFKLLQYISYVKNVYADKGKNIPKRICIKINRCYDKILAKAIEYHFSLPALKGKRRTGHNLALRLIKHKTGFLRCIYNKDIPFTNNQAERDMRMIKTKIKISPFRTEKGCKAFCAIRGFISTAKKHGLNILAALQNPQLLRI